MPNWGGGSANSGEANNNPGPDTEQAVEQVAEEQPAVEESTEDRGITGPSEISG